MLAKVLRVSSLPFLVTLDKCTTFARLDLGILSVGVVLSLNLQFDGEKYSDNL